MKTLILLFTTFICAGQSSIVKSTEKLINKWELKEFQEVERNGNIITVTKTKYAEIVSFEFKNDETLEVIYSDSKKEIYLWKLKREMIEITSANSEKHNSEILGVFEIYFMTKNSELFLQRKNEPHHGITLKV